MGARIPQRPFAIVIVGGLLAGAVPRAFICFLRLYVMDAQEIRIKLPLADAEAEWEAAN